MIANFAGLPFCNDIWIMKRSIGDRVFIMVEEGHIELWTPKELKSNML
jgi:hypothetical protein